MKRGGRGRVYLLRFGGALSEEPQRCIGPREIAVHGNPARRRKKEEEKEEGERRYGENHVHRVIHRVRK